MGERLYVAIANALLADGSVANFLETRVFSSREEAIGTAITAAKAHPSFRKIEGCDAWLVPDELVRAAAAALEEAAHG